MRNLIVCSDGTWNTPEQETAGIPTPTNVVRIRNAIRESTTAGQIEQLVYYHPGVGTDGSVKDSIVGGGTGKGLGEKVQSAYHWLASSFEPGDRIFLFGFSRGAYTSRSLAGMIARCGLLNLKQVSVCQCWKRVEKAFTAGYREGRPKSDWARTWKFHGSNDDPDTVHFVGVWDTVGALGIPNDFEILNLLDDPKKWQFFDVKLSDKIIHARHAVGMDEMRGSFAPTLWDGNHSGLKQQWFVGSHSDVGGGYPETGLSDIALRWMIEEAQACGLEFRTETLQQIKPDPHGVLHDSRKGFMRHLLTTPRSVPPAGSRLLHKSVEDRRSNPPITQAPYWTHRELKRRESTSVSVYASNPWNPTSLYMKRGHTYILKATGQWCDKNTTCGPGGTTDGAFQRADVAHILAGLLSAGKQLVTADDDATSQLDRRHPDVGWFALTGAIANGGNPTTDGTPAPPEHFQIGEGTIVRPRRSGYLYAFANDSWHFYGNNKGSVRLTIKRTR